METITKFLDFLDKREVFRRTAFIVVLAMTWEITQWAMKFAEMWLTGGKSGVDAAAIVGAVTIPFAALQGAVLKIYTDSKT